MKKTMILVGIVALFPLSSFAAFDSNLKYGMSGQAVYELQDLLAESGYLHVNPTGFFGLLTLNAVKDFQAANGLPNTGYFGVLSRGVANSLIEQAMSSSTQAEIQETGTTTTVEQPTPTVVPLSNVQGLSGSESPTLGVTQPVCTRSNPINPGALLYEFNVTADWSKTKLVVIKYGYNGFRGGDAVYFNSTAPLVLDHRNFQDGSLSYRLYAYDQAYNDETGKPVLDYAEGTITEPVCNI